MNKIKNTDDIIVIHNNKYGESIDVSSDKFLTSFKKIVKEETQKIINKYININV